ncbi:hypothetical protein ACFLZ8_01580 [Planctomycetota bacterium]
MSLISNGINSVRVYALPVGICSDGRAVQSPWWAMVQWCSDLNEVFFQVYVNGRYAGTTYYSKQRQMVVPIQNCFSRAVRIEVFAVKPEYADVDMSGELLNPWADSGRVKIKLLRRQDLPAGAKINIYFDSGTGEIDYENSLTNPPIMLWPAWQDKAGFGMSRFGFSDFGFDSAAAAGFGKGSFGYGCFGSDADAIEWISPQLETGTYQFGLIITDEKGNQSSVCETDSITVTPAPETIGSLEITSFDKGSNELILGIENLK